VNKTQRTCFAIAALVACGGASAQAAGYISQTGSNDQASIDQTSPAGTLSVSNIYQSGGANNVVTVLQANNVAGPAPGGIVGAYNSLTQQATIGDTAKVTQINAGVGSTVVMTQSNGSNSQVDLLQAGVSGAQMNINQSGDNHSQMVQQTAGTLGGFIRTGQTGSGSTMTVLQGQPSGGGVTNTQARVFQNGSTNTAVSMQAGGINNNTFVTQGGFTSPGYYYANSAGGYVEVDRTISGGLTTNSSATVYQTGGMNQTAYILQYGTALSGTIIQAGDGNLSGILQTGSSDTAYINQSGIAGNATVSQKGTGLNATISQGGAGNRATVTQR